MKKVPFVTLCIPLRNGENELKYTLSNILKTSYPYDQLEIIFGNHSSSDNSKKIIPDQKTAPNAISHLIPIPITTE